MMFIHKILICAFLMATITACSSAEPDLREANMTQAMELLVEVHNTLETDRLDPIMHPDFKRIAPDENADTRAEYKEFLRQFHSLFSDFNMTVDESAVNGDNGFIKWSVTGTYIGKGAREGGSPINVTGLGYYQFKDGKLISEFIGFNPGWFSEQL